MSKWKTFAVAAMVVAGIALKNEEEIKDGVNKVKTWFKKKLEKDRNEDATNESGTKKNGIEVPDEFLCPLTGEIMNDPVVSPYGNVFERAEIEKYLKIQDLCPLTGKPLKISQLTPSLTTREAIRKFKIECTNTI